ncbi:hypothetical protein [Methylorubrum extorquens]|uniref:hypothetical protein n=1 Tax=Methylorubrum extorquens TaxID=408 RepID=UPI0020A1A1E6|nr:hypothetical protein [Methylorubrum extorquens]MCP1540063.1 hypothetical protein [Methylorubrum extorquens]
MITTQKMTPAADAAGARYQTFVDGLSIIYAEAIGARDAGNASVIARAATRAYDLSRLFLEKETEAVKAAFGEIASDALSAANDDLGSDDTLELEDAASETLSATASYLLREITIQIERDIAQLQQAIRQTFLHARLNAQAAGTSLRRALLEHQFSSREAPAFHFRDRRNGKWPSRLFVRSTWRQALLSVFNEVTLTVLAAHGIGTAQIEHAHAKAGVHGQLVALGSNTALPAYGEIRNDIFHPNAEAVLRVPEQHRS